MAEMEHYPNFQKDNYIHPKAAWDKLRMAGARRQNVYLYAATGYGKTELLHRYLRRRRHIWLSGEGLTVETLQEIALPAEATMVIDDLARVLDPAVRREIVSMLEQPGLWLVLAGRCPLPSWLTGPYVNGRLSVIPEEDLRLSEKEIAQLYLSWGVQLPRNLLEKRIIPLVEGNPLGARLLAVEMSRGSSYTEELMNDLTRKFYEYLNQAIYSEWPEEIREMMMQLSLLEHFTIQQAEEMTGRSDVNRLLAQAAEMGNLFSFKDGGYTLRPAVINSMKLRMETVCDRVRKNELLRRAGTICTERLVMPEFSVTGGQPSLINGSKDFCDWTRDDQTMAFQLEKHVGEVLGPYSKGLVSIGLAESLFEKGGNIYKVLELANRGLMETMNGGKFELEFVGAALVARVYLVTGHPGDSVKTLEELETRAQQRGARRVVRNVRAMQSRIKLWQGRVEDAVRWMENEPQNEIHFNVLERYCYNTFVRVYMAQQRYDKTAQILMRLRSYANIEKRPWLQMEGDLLESIIRYRTGNPLWKTELTQVLRRAESYHFVRLFCREGAALLPLLQELGCPEGVDEAYWQEVLGKTRTMAEAYPLYLSTNAPAALPGAVQLSERALQVLRLQDRGLTRSEIARQLQLSERSVKYQCEQAYHKLGTGNKVEALAAARKLNLL